MNLTPREKDKLLVAMAAMVARRRLERGRARGRVQRRGVEPDALERLRVEADAGVGAEALADHPAEWNARKVCGILVVNRAATDV